MTETDLELIELYARDHAEDAFTEIVRRHLNLVHSAAFRQVRSLQLAEEVAQSVFTDLARNAQRLAPDTIVTAWLYQVTRRTAIDVVRREARRQLREQIATEMNATNATSNDWTNIEPLLDEAMHALEDKDRAAVLLRYFENKSLREVGQTIGASEDAAQKRVSRAVERLREFFTKRGVTVGPSGLVVCISANAVQAAPAGLAVTISTTAGLIGTAVSTSTAIAVNAIAMTTLQKTLITAAVAIVTGVGIYEARQASQLRDQVEMLQEQQAPLGAQIQQLQRERDEATNRLGTLRDDKDLRKERLELLSLRGRVTQLANELRGQKANQPKIADTKTNTEPAEADSILFSASLTNRVAGGQTLVLGGWSKDGMRGYFLLTPSIPQGGNLSELGQLTVQGQMVEAPESFWSQIGWADAKSETHRSALAGMLTRDQLETLLQALKESKGAEITSTSPATGHDGERMGFGFARADDNPSGALMGIDLYPRIASDGQSVDFEIFPSPLSPNDPIHRSLSPRSRHIAR